MTESPLDTLVRAMSDGENTRRGLARGLAALAVTAGLARFGLWDADARKKKNKDRKRKSRRKRRRARGIGNGDTSPPGGALSPGGNTPPPPAPPPVSPPPPPVCDQTICDGQCVDTGADQNNCGACGNACRDLFFCCGGTCRSRLNDDNLNCGACGRVCTGGDRCCFGRCIGRFELCG